VEVEEVEVVLNEEEVVVEMVVVVWLVC